jgi:hypothetical protein
MRRACLRDLLARRVVAAEELRVRGSARDVSHAAATTTGRNCFAVPSQLTNHNEHLSVVMLRHARGERNAFPLRGKVRMGVGLGH